MASASPGRTERRGPGRVVWDFLRSNDLGTILLLAIGALFVLGSLVREVRPADYEALRGDDLRFFLARFRAVDLWFWLLAAASLLLGSSLAACAIDALARRVRMRARDPRDYGPIVVHVAVGLALLAHASMGLRGSEAAGVVTASAQAPVGPHEVLLLGTAAESHPDGTTKRQSARVSILARDGVRLVREIGPNAPARWDGGAEMLVLLRVDEAAGEAVLSIDGSPDTLAAGETRILGDGGRLAVERLFGPPDFRVRVARVRISGGPRDGSHLIGQGVASGVQGIDLLAVRTAPAAVVLHRTAPGIGLLLASAWLLAAGVILTCGRRLRTDTIARAAFRPAAQEGEGG